MLPSILDFESDVREYLGLSSLNAALAEFYHRTVEAAVRRYVGHGIAQNTYTNEYHRRGRIGPSGSGAYVQVDSEVLDVGMLESGSVDGHILQLDNSFVRSITEIREDSNGRFGQGSGFGSGTTLSSGSDYYLELDSTGICKSGRVIRHYRNWCNEPGSIRVTYVAGLTSAELDNEYSFVKMAILHDIQDAMESNLARRSEAGVVKKKTYFGDVSTEYVVQSGEKRSATGLLCQTEAALMTIKRMTL